MAVVAVVALVAIQFWPRPAPSGGYLLFTRPAGAEVWQKSMQLVMTTTTTGTQDLIRVGTTPGPLSISASESQWDLELRLWGYRELPVHLERSGFDAGRRWPETLSLEPKVPVLVPALYLARDYPWLLAALAVAGWLGLSEGLARRRTRLNEARLARGELSPGAELDGYRLEAMLGQGGMARVYRARHGQGEPVAIKVLFRGLDDEMRREVQVARTLRHPRLVHLMDWGEVAGLPYVVWELVEGETLERRLERGPVSRLETLAWATQVAEGLAYLHRNGVAHRDIKPSNVILTARGARLIDFGIASRAELAEGTLGPGAGTAGYAPLEQWQGLAVWQSDIYALGALLYRMLSGRLPFEGSSLPEILKRQAEGTVAPLDDPLDPLLARWLSPDPSARAGDPDEPLRCLRGGAAG